MKHPWIACMASFGIGMATLGTLLTSAQPERKPTVGACFWVQTDILRITSVGKLTFQAEWLYQGRMLSAYFPNHDFSHTSPSDCPEELK